MCAPCNRLQTVCEKTRENSYWRWALAKTSLGTTVREMGLAVGADLRLPFTCAFCPGTHCCRDYVHIVACLSRTHPGFLLQTHNSWPRSCTRIVIAGSHLPIPLPHNALLTLAWLTDMACAASWTSLGDCLLFIFFAQFSSTLCGFNVSSKVDAFKTHRFMLTAFEVN